MTSEEIQLAMLTVGQIPILKSLVTNAAVLDDPKWSVYMKQLESAKARIPSPNNDEIKTIWSNAMTDIFLNGADVATTLNSAAAAIDAELE
jgi:multiple sugar transport system substrate-binding protein